MWLPQGTYMTSFQKNPWMLLSLMGFPGQKYNTFVATFLLVCEECTLCDPLMWGKEHKEACTWVLPDSAYMFFLHHLAVYPHYVTVINLSHEYSYMLSPLTFSKSSSKSLNIGMIWGTDNTEEVCSTVCDNKRKKERLSSEGNKLFFFNVVDTYTLMERDL